MTWDILFEIYPSLVFVPLVGDFAGATPGQELVPKTKTSGVGVEFFYILDFTLSLSLLLKAIFPGEPGLAGFIGAKDDGSGGDNWSYKTCKASVKSPSPTNQHPVFLQVGCLFCHPTVSKH